MQDDVNNFDIKNSREMPCKKIFSVPAARKRIKGLISGGENCKIKEKMQTEKNIMRLFPQLETDLNIVRRNASEIKRRCGESGIKLTPAVKGVNADAEVVRAILDAGIEQLGTSRLSQIERCNANGIKAGWLLLRIPQLCECADVVRLAEVSLESGVDTVTELEKECVRQGRSHKIIMMLDTGDLREGYWDRARLLDDCAKIKKTCPHIRIAGIGSNFTDYGATVPTVDKLEELAAMARRMEEILGYPLEYVSGGATTSYPLVHRGEMPKGINHLRVGEAIILNHDLPDEWGIDTDYLASPVLLRAQVVEVYDKPSVPVGETATDAFDNHPVFTERGIRRRALLALGRADVGDAGKLLPCDGGAEILAATSDHTIIDIGDCEREIRVGDIMEFRLTYENLMYASLSEDVRKIYKNA